MRGWQGRVPFSPVTQFFASRRPRTPRFARLRAVRVLACLLAISLVFGGYFAAAAPLHAAMAAASTGADGCGHDGMVMPAKHGHASDACCRVACACAFAHAVDVAPLACTHAAPASASLARAPDARAPRVVNPPPLRPPIA
ncbi:hypothetical protein EV148_10850 [Dokdonella fugitiva]|uniref:Uncharacterized protein n=1 Tax=Dokdonella fugitiva TaxID=328517 RepID=A0A4R2I2G6_9GAMM|nr:hypothetical protein EV148_10850 [Dokdonella fugitiva]